MKKLSMLDLDDLAVGAAVLGSGGGGNPALELLIAKQQFEDFGSPKIVSLETIDDDALVVPVAFMGAPLVGIERLPSGSEFIKIIELIELIKGKKVTHFVAGEIGGSNAFTPLIAAAKLNVPVIDADLLGRAFPELQMSSAALNGIVPSPTVICDCLDNVVSVHAKTGTEIERFCRGITVEMGSSAAIALYLMTGKQAKESMIPNTMSHGVKIGRTMRIAKEKNEDPVEALLNYTKGTLLARGVITDITQKIEDGFLTGTFTISGENEIKVYYQNEYLMAYEKGVSIASTPDIIMPLEVERGYAITSESLSYGLRVALVMIPGPAIWKTEEGLKLVGPKYFGYSEKEEDLSCQKNIS